MIDLQSYYSDQIKSTLTINNIYYDSRSVTAGSCFVALSGTKVDGHNYLQKAVDLGAVAVIVERKMPDLEVPQIVVEDSHLALATLSNALHPYKKDALTIVGVTGTDGKTSTASILEQALKYLGQKTGYIGTNGIYFNDTKLNLACTTPLAPELHAVIEQMQDEHVAYLAMEVSSHALATKRVEMLRFAYTIFTNLSHDHLDFHKTFAHYKKSKAHLFDLQLPNGLAILNLDDINGAIFAEELAQEGKRVATFSLINQEATMFASKISYTIEGMHFVLNFGGRQYPITTTLLGDFNISNMLSVCIVLIDLGYTMEQVVAAMETLNPIAGRMELSFNPQSKIAAIVDFGHAPEAIKQVLSFAKELTPTRLTVITGAVGDGDVSKRPEMAANAVHFSDRCIFTMDNPYSEDPDVILDELVAGLDSATYQRIDGRKEAITHAFATALPGELIVVLGRGRETTITNGTTLIELSDYDYVQELLFPEGYK